MTNLVWLVWSHEHGAYWGPGERGYVTCVGEAGRYTLRRAAEICKRANLVRGPDVPPHELIVPSPELLIRCGAALEKMAVPTAFDTLPDDYEAPHE